MTYRWTVKGAERMAKPGAQPRRAHIEGRLRYDAAVDAWLDQFLDLWLDEEGACQHDGHEAMKNKAATVPTVAAQ